MARTRTLEDLDLGTLASKTVLVRVDFNVPLVDGRVADDTRLIAALPTIAELRRAGARVLLASHCGRPKGEPDPGLSLRPVAERLSELIEGPVAFADDCVGETAESAARALAPGEVCLLENLRFHSGEKKNDPLFAAALAGLADAYVDDAFGTSHRAHASVVGVPERLRRNAAGRLLVREVEVLGRLLESPERPFVAIAGGAKIAGKLDTLENLLPRLDALVLGGGMANTFLAARGLDLGESLVERDRLDLALEILQRAEDLDTRVVLPADLVVCDDLESPNRIETVAAEEVPSGTKAVDIGLEGRAELAREVAAGATIFWNGPLGVFEKPPFDEGTLAAAHALAETSGFTVAGGGETVAAVRKSGVGEQIDHLSTGGGASLELLAGKILPGVSVLEVNK
ncbi:MAG: phosphoglycerate kinase [Acidobacteriota bacterium]|nr:phosphoglycerate kinase [Acidobacteriota bacterium]